MRKVAGAMVAAFMVGGGVMAVMGAVIGPLAEAAVLSMVGVSLYASSTMLQARESVPEGTMAKEA
jgi:hypothetical protein